MYVVADDVGASVFASDKTWNHETPAGLSHILGYQSSLRQAQQIARLNGPIRHQTHHCHEAFSFHRPRAGAGWAASASCWHEQANPARGRWKLTASWQWWVWCLIGPLSLAMFEPAVGYSGNQGCGWCQQEFHGFISFYSGFMGLRPVGCEKH